MGDDDVFTKMASACQHDAACGLGEDYVDRLISRSLNCGSRCLWVR
jgi:hypothetical protein